MGIFPIGKYDESVNNTGTGQERILSCHPFIEIRNYDIVCLAQAKNLNSIFNATFVYCV